MDYSGRRHLGRRYWDRQRFAVVLLATSAVLVLALSLALPSLHHLHHGAAPEPTECSVLYLQDSLVPLLGTLFLALAILLRPLTLAPRCFSAPFFSYLPHLARPPRAPPFSC